MGRERSLGFGLCVTSEDPLPPVTTVSLPVAQFNSSQKPFVAFGNVAISVPRLEQS
jgi:hypothetical protein